MNTIKEETVTIREPVYSGAVYGAMGWTVYAIAECWFTIILPWIIKPGYAYTPLHSDFTVLLFIIYPVVSILRLKNGINRSVISESYPNNFLVSWHTRFHSVERAIFSWPYKFISSTGGKKELYDLSKYPDEKENLYRPDDSISGELELQLSQRLKSVAVESPPPAKLDEGALDRLKALGYVK